jgi:hypothetical protein
VSAPDLWTGLGKTREFIEDGQRSSFGNTPFTLDEEAAVSAQLRAIKTHIRETYSPTTDQMSHIEARLDAAEEASRRIGRKDWIMMFNGAVFSLILSDLAPPAGAQHILMLALHGLGHLFGVGGLPPQPAR